MAPTTDFGRPPVPRQFAEPIEHPGCRVAVAHDHQGGQVVVGGFNLGFEIMRLK
jgi:hypothetical protein